MRPSRGGRPERTLGEHPHVLGGRVVCRKGVDLVPSMPHPHAPAPSRAGLAGCLVGWVGGGRGGCACCCVHPHRATREFAGLQGLRTFGGLFPYAEKAPGSVNSRRWRRTASDEV